MAGRSIGIILLCIWLIVGGILGLTNLQIQFAAPLMAVLAIFAGIFLLAGK
jgi:hypothetical protein